MFEFIDVFILLSPGTSVYSYLASHPRIPTDTKSLLGVPCANTQSHGTKLQGQKISNMNTSHSTKNQKVMERKGFQCMEPGTSP